MIRRISKPLVLAALGLAAMAPAVAASDAAREARLNPVRATAPELKLTLLTTNLDRVVDTGRLRVAVTPLKQTVQPLLISVGTREGGEVVPITRRRGFAGPNRRVLTLPMTRSGLARVEPETTLRVLIVVRRAGRIIQTSSRRLER
jgi:hypothetical protein